MSLVLSVYHNGIVKHREFRVCGACSESQPVVLCTCMLHAGIRCQPMAAKAAGEAIYEAATDGDAGVVARMLDEDPGLLSTICWGNTLLSRAAWKGHAGVVRVLLERGADVSTQDADWDTALHSAAIMGHEEVVSLLLTNGADIRSRGDRGRTALICASEDGRLAVVRLLLRHLGGRGLDDRDDDGCTALWYASVTECGYADVLRVLLLSGADHTIPDDNGLTPQQMVQDYSYHDCAAVMEVSTPSVSTPPHTCLNTTVCTFMPASVSGRNFKIRSLRSK